MCELALNVASLLPIFWHYSRYQLVDLVTQLCSCPWSVVRVLWNWRIGFAQGEKILMGWFLVEYNITGRSIVNPEKSQVIPHRAQHYRQKYWKIWNFRGVSSQSTTLQAEILQNSEKARVFPQIAQYYRQKYCKIMKRRRCLVPEHPLKNMNWILMSRGRIGKMFASPCGTEKILWNRCSYQVSEMVGTNAYKN